MTIILSAQNKVLRFNGTHNIGIRFRKMVSPQKINSAMGADRFRWKSNGSDEDQQTT